MSKPVAILGDYTDLVFRKTRSVAVISIEIPIESAADFVARFGTPNPAQGVPVALARVMPEPKAPATGEPVKPIDEPKERRKFNDLPLSQQCAMRCNEPLFAEFLWERFPESKENGTADTMYKQLGIKSRSELNDNRVAASYWRKLDDDYRFWVSHRGQAA